MKTRVLQMHWMRVAFLVCALAIVSVQISLGQTPPKPELVFASDRAARFQLWKVQLDPLGTPVQLTTAGSGSQESRNPTWSKQGKIAYQFGASGVRGIHMISADGSGDVRLTTSGSDEIDPSWSPDGQFIAYAFLTGGNYDIWIHKVGDPNTTADDEDYAFFTSAGQENRPAWSPDGSKIAFVSTLNGGDGEIVVATVVPDTANPGRIKVGSATFLTDNTFIDFDPTWSPDGQQIAFSSTRTGTRDIYRMNAVLGESDAGNLVQLTTNSAADLNPAWSPDGRQIAFVSERDGNREIYVMSATAGEADASMFVRITNDLSRDDDPAWEQKPSVLFGVDVSTFQGDITAVQWTQIKDSGKDFAWIRASKGNANVDDCRFRDGRFTANITCAKAAKLLVGAYHVGNVVQFSAAEEAQFFVSVAGDYMKAGFLRPVLDLEPHSCGDPASLGTAGLATWVDQFMNTVKALTGITPLIYCNAVFLPNLDSSLAQKYDLWIAKFTENPESTVDVTPWSAWTAFQYSESGSVAGISPIDLDVFSGTLEDFHSRLVISTPKFSGVGGGAIQPPSNGQFQMQISAPGWQQVIMQASDELATWSEVATVTITNGTGIFTDTNAGAHTKRFYRPKP